MGKALAYIEKQKEKASVKLLSGRHVFFCLRHCYTLR